MTIATPVATPTHTVPPTQVFALAHKVQSSWQTSPALFTGYEIAKADFDTLLDAAAAADSHYQQVKAATVASKTTAKQAYKQALADAKAAYTQAMQTADVEASTALLARSSALVTLSRAAQGARYFAKSKALSDSDLANDTVGKNL